METASLDELVQAVQAAESLEDARAAAVALCHAVGAAADVPDTAAGLALMSAVKAR